MEELIKAVFERNEFNRNVIKIVDKITIDACQDENMVLAKDHQDKRVERMVGEYIMKDINQCLCDQSKKDIYNQYKHFIETTHEVSLYCFNKEQLIRFCKELIHAKLFMPDHHEQQQSDFKLPHTDDNLKYEYDESDLV